MTRRATSSRVPARLGRPWKVRAGTGTRRSDVGAWSAALLGPPPRHARARQEHLNDRMRFDHRGRTRSCSRATAAEGLRRPRDDSRSDRRRSTRTRARTCLTPKLTMDGVSRFDSVFSTTSMPLRRARATTLLELPKSRPTTDILLFSTAGELQERSAFRSRRARDDRATLGASATWTRGVHDVRGRTGREVASGP